jgi:hypothetical protein
MRKLTYAEKVDILMPVMPELLAEEFGCPRHGEEARAVAQSNDRHVMLEFHGRQVVEDLTEFKLRPMS